MSINSENAGNLADASNALICVGCGTANPSSQKFCSKCGEGLTFACPECDAENPVDSSFCGSCGFDLRQIFEDGENAFGTAVAEAKEKASQLDITGAIRVLVSAMDSPIIKLKSHKNELKSLVTGYRTQKNELKSDAEEQYKKAKYHYENKQPTEALKLLNDIPTTIRSSEAEELLNTVRHEVAEVKRLTSEIDGLISKKDLLGALPLIKALLQLTPDDEKLKKLAAEIVKRVLAKVQQLKQKGQLKEAFGLVQRVAELGSSSKTDDIHQELKEIVWLSNYVKKAQTVDAGLVKALEKLAQLTGSDENKKYFAEAKKRYSTVVSHPAKNAGWSPAPKQPLFEMLVSIAPSRNFIEGFDALNVENHSQAYFQVAAGLALQGLGQCEMPINLVPKKKSLFGFGGQRTGKTAIGIDFGNAGVKAVKLSLNGQAIKLEQVAFFEYENTDPMASAAESRSNMLQALLKLKSGWDLKKEDVLVTNLNHNHVLGRYLSIPDADPKSLKAAMEFEVKLQIPFPLTDVVWDSYTFPTAIKEKRLALVVATRTNDAQLIEEMFSANGMKLAAIQSESVALYNFHRMGAQRAGGRLNEVILDIGYTSSTMTFISTDRIWFRSFGMGTNNFAKSLSRKLRLNTPQANELLRSLPKADDEIIKAMMSFEDPYQELVSEISRSLQGYEHEMDAPAPEHIYCVGGGTKLHGLLTFLRHPAASLSVDQ